MYLSSARMPDISFAVSKLSRFVSNPGDVHWHALERIMRYLDGTASYGLHIPGIQEYLKVTVMQIGYLMLMSLKRQVVYVFTLGGAAVS